MKLVACLVVFCSLFGVAFAAERPLSKGTLVSVVLHDTSDPAENFPDARPGRTPTTPLTYTYEFKVRLGCAEYTGLYDSYRKKLAEQFKPDEDVEIRATKRLLYLTFHGQEETLRMSISSHRQLANCTTGARP